MAAFDPDKYLAKNTPKSSDGFDPDAYLSATSQPEGPQKKSPGLLKNLEAGVESFGKEASFGYLPELQAAAEPLMFKAFSALTGKDVESSGDFKERKKGYVQRGKALAEEAPIASTVGSVAGALSTPIPVAKGAGLLSNIGRAAATGAVTGAAYNPYAESEEVGVGLEDRAKQALRGGLLSGGTQGLIGAAGKGIQRASEGAQKASDYFAVKALGPFKKDIKNLLNRNKYEDVADFVKTEKIAGIGSDAESILDKVAGKVNETGARSGGMINEVGSEIGNIYKKAQEKLSDTNFLKNLKPNQLKKISETSKDGTALAINVLDDLEAAYKGVPGGQQAINYIQNTIIEPLSMQGDNIQDLMKFRSQVDDMVNWSKRNNEIPVNQNALKVVRDRIQKSIEDRINALDDVLKGSDLKRLKELNKKFSLASTVKEIASNRVEATRANMTFGLPELLVGTGYGAMGGGFTPEGVAKGLLGAAAVKAGRTYGPGIASKALQPIAKKGKKISKGILSVSPGLVGRQLGDE